MAAWKDYFDTAYRKGESYENRHEIAEHVARPITDIAEAAGIPHQALEHYGSYKAKVNPGRLADGPDGKLIS